MKKKVLVIGASRGIGLEFCRQYLEEGYEVHAVCRSKTDEVKNLSLCSYFDIDINQEKDQLRLIDCLKNHKFSFIIYNAGLFLKDSFGSLKKDSLLRQFETNSLFCFC